MKIDAGLNELGLNMWFREDIQFKLTSIMATVDGPLSMIGYTPELRAYRRGFEDAIRAVALTFGLSVPTPTATNRQPTNERSITK